MTRPTVRVARAADLPGLLGIYNHYVLHTHVTFDNEPFTLDTRKPWFEQFDGRRRQCWVAYQAEQALGYACSTVLKPKQAYETSVEVSVYLAPEALGRGTGTALYRALLDGLSHEDVHRAYALVAQPNEASMALHRTFGFSPAAHLTEVGRKFGRYWDVVWLERAMPAPASNRGNV